MSDLALLIARWDNTINPDTNFMPPWVTNLASHIEQSDWLAARIGLPGKTERKTE